MILCVILCMQYCVLVLAGYTGTDLIGEDSIVGQIDFESENDDWTLTNLRIISLNDSMENMYNIPGEGHVAVPQVSMSGRDMGEMVIMLRIPVKSRLAVKFSVYVSGFDPKDNTSFSQNPELLISLSEVNTTHVEKLTSLERLYPENDAWNNRRTEVETGGSLGVYKLSVEVSMGSGTMALDELSVEIWPLVDTNYHRKDKHNSTTTSDENVTKVTNDSESSGEKFNNNTEPLETTDRPNNQFVNSTTNSPDNPEEFNNNTTSAKDDGHDTTEHTIEVNTTISNLTASPLMPQDSSMYGYTGEVILICLAVIFIILFLGMVYKYHRLKSHMGDYRLNQSSDRQSGHDNHGMQVQMNYREED